MGVLARAGAATKSRLLGQALSVLPPSMLCVEVCHNVCVPALATYLIQDGAHRGRAAHAFLRELRVGAPAQVLQGRRPGTLHVAAKRLKVDACRCTCEQAACGRA
jgi:hypothetical protein